MTDRSLLRPLTFLGVGVVSAVVDLGVFSLLEWLGVVPAAASAAGFLSAFAVNYSGNRVLVFRARHSRGALGRYVVLVAANLVMTTALVAALVALDVQPHAAKVVSMALNAAVNYVAMRRWVFPAAPPAPGPAAPEAP